MDIQQQLERDIGHGPALPTPQERLAAGHAALRRRRVTVAAGAAAMLVVIAAPFVLNGSGATRGTDLPPAAPPASPSVPEPSPDRTPPAEPEPRFDRSMGDVAYVDVLTSELMIHPDAVVVERVDGLYPGKDTESVALDLKLDGKRYWVELEWDDGGSAGTFGGPQDDFYEDFDDFVAKATSGGGMTSGPTPGSHEDDDAPVPGKVEGLTMTPDGLVASGGTRIIEQRLDPDLPDGFATEEMRTAAAYVQMAGVRQLVLFRDDIGGGMGELIAVHSAGHGDSLASLLDWARERYESGMGLL